MHALVAEHFFGVRRRVPDLVILVGNKQSTKLANCDAFSLFAGNLIPLSRLITPSIDRISRASICQDVYVANWPGSNAQRRPREVRVKPLPLSLVVVDHST